MGSDGLVVAKMAFRAVWPGTANYFFSRDKVWKHFSGDFPLWTVNYTQLSLQNKDKSRIVKITSNECLFNRNMVTSSHAEIDYLVKFVKYVLTSFSIDRLTFAGIRILFLDKTDKTFEDITEELAKKYFRYRIPGRPLKDFTYTYMYDLGDFTVNIMTAAVTKDEVKEKYEVMSDDIPDVARNYDIECRKHDIDAPKVEQLLRDGHKEFMKILKTMREE